MGILSRIHKILLANLPHPDIDAPYLKRKRKYKRYRTGREDSRNSFASEQSAGSTGRRSNETAAPRDPELAQCYANLEIPYGSDLQTTRRAWKRLLRKYHPDLHSGDPEKMHLANELVKGLNRAYEKIEKQLQSNHENVNR